MPVAAQDESPPRAGAKLPRVTGAADKAKEAPALSHPKPAEPIMMIPRVKTLAEILAVKEAAAAAEKEAAAAAENEPAAAADNEPAAAAENEPASAAEKEAAAAAAENEPATAPEKEAGAAAENEPATAAENATCHRSAVGNDHDRSRAACCLRI
jgi:hypothetical protein